MSHSPPPSSVPAKSQFQQLFEQALECHRAGDVEKAEAAYRKLLLFYPDHTPSLVNLGVILKARGQFETAIALYRRAYALDPASVSLLGNLGNVLLLTGKFEEALLCHEKVLKARAESAEAFFNKGLTLRAMGRLPQAIFCFDRALSLQEEYVEAEWDRSLTLLMNGDYQDGFVAYESRWRLPYVTKPTFGTIPEWNGSAPQGKIILVYTEQGFGDSLQFVRYCDQLKAKGATVLFYCQPEIATLLEGTESIHTIIPIGRPLPPFDTHISLLSLPRLLGTSAKNVPQNVPYLIPPKAAPMPFLARPKNDVKVGIVWAGKPSHRNDKNRSLDFSAFLRLFSVPGTSFFSLQMGERSADIAVHGMEGMLYDLTPHITDYRDTAQIIEQLDLVITVDTSVAHLAGGMGRPVWVLLPMVGDWRWGQIGDSTPWYPTMMLFRQTSFHQWSDVLEEVAKKLEMVVAMKTRNESSAA
jgi:Tfp pilus assembly protein PilF